MNWTNELNEIVKFISESPKGDLNFDPSGSNIETKILRIREFFNKLNIRKDQYPKLFANLTPSKWIEILDKKSGQKPDDKTYGQKLFHSDDKLADLTNRVDRIFDEMKSKKLKKLILLDGHGRTVYLFCKKMITNNYYFDIEIWEFGTNTALWHDYFFPQKTFQDETGTERKIYCFTGDVSNSICKEFSNTCIYLNFCGIGEPIPGIIFKFLKYFKKYRNNNLSLWVSGYKDHHEPNYLLQPQKTNVPSQNLLLNIIRSNTKVGIWLLLSLISSGSADTKRTNETKVKDNVTQTINTLGTFTFGKKPKDIKYGDISKSNLKTVYKITDLNLFNKILEVGGLKEKSEILPTNTDDTKTYAYNYTYKPKIYAKDYKTLQDKINRLPEQEAETVRWHDKELKNAAFVTWHVDINKIDALEKYNGAFNLDNYSDFNNYYSMLQEQIGFLSRTYAKYIKYKTKYLELKKLLEH